MSVLKHELNEIGSGVLSFFLFYFLDELISLFIDCFVLKGF